MEYQNSHLVQSASSSTSLRLQLSPWDIRTPIWYSVPRVPQVSASNSRHGVSELPSGAVCLEFHKSPPQTLAMGYQNSHLVQCASSATSLRLKLSPWDIRTPIWYSLPRVPQVSASNSRHGISELPSGTVCLECHKSPPHT